MYATIFCYSFQSTTLALVLLAALSSAEPEPSYHRGGFVGYSGLGGYGGLGSYGLGYSRGYSGIGFRGRYKRSAEPEPEAAANPEPEPGFVGYSGLGGYGGVGSYGLGYSRGYSRGYSGIGFRGRYKRSAEPEPEPSYHRGGFVGYSGLGGYGGLGSYGLGYSRGYSRGYSGIGFRGRY